MIGTANDLSGYEGDAARTECATDLDQVLLHRDPAKIEAFLAKWGESLRELLTNLTFAEDDGGGYD